MSTSAEEAREMLCRMLVEMYYHSLRPRKKTRRKRKLIEIDGKFYRKRRGKLVEIPSEWVGRTTHPQTVRKRRSKKSQGRKFRRKVRR